MTDPTLPTPAKKPQSFWLDFGPLLIFFAAFQYFKRTQPDDAMVYAAGVLGVTAILALLYSWIRHRHVSGLLVFTTAIVVLFAGLAFFTGNKVIFFMKPTILNTLFGLAVIGGVFFKKNVVKLLMGSAIELPESKWNVLAIRWGLFFFAMAVLNEIIWRNFSEDFWAGFKVFGFLPLTIVFTLTQIPFIQRFGKMKTSGESST